MYLQSISLENYRSFSLKTTFDFHEKFTLIVGLNSVGKTNLLESIYFLSQTQGFREKQLIDLVNEKEKNAVVEGTINDSDKKEKYSIRLLSGESAVSKNFYINSLKKSSKQYQQRVFKVVLFEPDDILIVSKNASIRRNYFNQILKSIYYQYYSAINSYNRALYKRNRILENQSKYSNIALGETLKFWDEYLDKQALCLQENRQNIVDFYNLHPQLNGMSFNISYQQNLFIPSSDNHQLTRELKVKRTLSGPQLDEFIFYSTTNNKKKNLLEYGSRSEQRLCVLWLKLNELKFIEDQTKFVPILLMDDIFSELDSANSKRILSVAENYQTIITTAHLDVLSLISSNHKLDFKKITLSL